DLDGARRVDRDIAARCDAPAPAHVETAVAGHGDVAGRGGHVDLAHVAAVAVRGVEGRVDDDAALRIQTEAAAGGAIVDVIAAVDADACARDVDVALHGRDGDVAADARGGVGLCLERAGYDDVVRGLEEKDTAVAAGHRDEPMLRGLTLEG